MTSASRLNRWLSSSLAMSLATIVSSVIGLAFSLALPFLITADAYATFSLIMSFSQLAANVCFEFARSAIVRFADMPDQEVRKTRRGVLAFCYIAMSAVLVLVAVVATLAPLPHANLIFLGAVSALFQGLLSGQLSLLRAEFRNALFVTSVVLRPVAMLVLGLGCGALFLWSMEGVFWGVTLSFAVTMLIGGQHYVRFFQGARFNWPELKFVFGFGSLTAIASNLSVAIPAVIRANLAARLGLSEAGGVLLAIDLGQRVFTTLGSAVNVALIQSAIRERDYLAGKGQTRKLRLQTLALSLLILPALCALPFLIGPIAALAVPEAYRASFVEAGMLVLAGLGIMTIRQYSIDSLFLVFGRTFGAPVGPVVMIAALVLFAALPQPASVAPALWVGVEIVLASLAGLGTALALVRRFDGLVVAWRDLLGLLAACGAVLAISLVLPHRLDVLPLAIGIVALPTAYVALVLAFDVLGLRSGLAEWRNKRSGA